MTTAQLLQHAAIIPMLPHPKILQYFLFKTGLNTKTFTHHSTAPSASARQTLHLNRNKIKPAHPSKSKSTSNHQSKSQHHHSHSNFTMSPLHKHCSILPPSQCHHTQIILPSLHSNSHDVMKLLHYFPTNAHMKPHLYKAQTMFQMAATKYHSNPAHDCYIQMLIVSSVVYAQMHIVCSKLASTQNSQKPQPNNTNETNMTSKKKQEKANKMAQSTSNHQIKPHHHHSHTSAQLLHHASIILMPLHPNHASITLYLFC